MATYSVKLDMRYYCKDHKKMRELNHIIDALTECDVEIELVNYLDVISPWHTNGYDALHEAIYFLPHHDNEKAIAKIKIKLDLARMELLIGSEAASLIKLLNKRKVHVELINPERVDVDGEGGAGAWAYYIAGLEDDENS